jgi:hypothetical protein
VGSVEEIAAFLETVESGGYIQGYYNSASKGLVRIVDMHDHHVVNAALKLYREWVNGIKMPTLSQFLELVTAGPSDPTFMALCKEAKKRAERSF